ncbi:hypothetical protein J1N35_021701 [Gossypium stocksii]|uniref:Endonuclease/exonuclease/phosphatase domain-containing protein n=1 Tax=Gossypium stocksii TaxID=47602 RepID=A0A9D4A279_9ROSI|nr:hypothetical protein J1N35_021701 [Gossypium stocksii]
MKDQMFFCLLGAKDSLGSGLRLTRKLGFDGLFEVLALRFRDGLIFLWHKNRSNLMVKDFIEQVICYEVKEGDNVWYASFSYVQPSFEAKNCFWEHLRSFASTCSAPWVVSGDFNDFASSNEHCGGSGDCFEHMLQFKDRWSQCNLLDVGFSSSKFVWVHKLHGEDGILEVVVVGLGTLLSLGEEVSESGSWSEPIPASGMSDTEGHGQKVGGDDNAISRAVKGSYADKR